MITYSANYVYPISSPAIKDGLVTLDDTGKVVAIVDPSLPQSTAPASPPKRFDGVLIPAFINAHCHLELSHLRGVSSTGKTLLPFLKDVVTLRDTAPEEIERAIREQDRLMWAAGIQAVGDICNKSDTAETKRNSPIRYYSFVEMFDFLQADRAQATYERYLPAYHAQPEPKSAVPHAPYTVSDPLYERINGLNPPGRTVSIHNQETTAEDELFQTGGGEFPAFFAGFGAHLDAFRAPGTPSIDHALQRLDPGQRTLFVHNTLTTREAIQRAHDWGKNGVYWASCPNANLYIENRLPRYDRFLETGAKVCIGTDSLTSNWQLSILEELRTISRYQSYVPFASLLQWATLNGAEALQFDADLGSLEVGKTPGLLCLSGLEGDAPERFRIGAGTQVQRVH